MKSPSQELSTESRPNLHFWGVRRSGNHAVLGWIIASADREGLQIEHFNDIHDQRMTVPKIPRPGDPELTPKPDTDLTIFSYQDVALGDIPHVPFFAGDLGAQSMTVTRDLPNLLASRITMYEDLENRGLGHRSVTSFSFDEVAAMWAEYAQNFLDNPNPESGNVHFPLWFRSRDYRDEVLGVVNLGPNEDAGINRVSNFGFGSSFDQQAYDGRAQEMAVLDRWKVHADKPEYQAAFGPYRDLSTQFDAYAL